MQEDNIPAAPIDSPITVGQLRPYFEPEGLPHLDIAVKNLQLTMANAKILEQQQQIAGLESRVKDLEEPQLPEPPDSP